MMMRAMRKPAAIGIAIVILLAASLLLLVIWTGNEGVTEREIPGIGTPEYIYTGDDDTLYLFSAKNITAVSPDGTLKYRFSLPANYSFCERWNFDSSWDNVYVRESGQPIASSDNGTLYTYLVPDGGEAKEEVEDDTPVEYYDTGLLLSISPEGRQQWSLPLESLLVPTREYQYTDSLFVPGPLEYTIEVLSDAHISVSNGTLYVFHGYNETTIDANGTLLWTIGGVTDPATVDETGNIYVVGVSSLPKVVTDTGKPIVTYYGTFGKEDYHVPGMIVDSYYPNGSLRWRTLTVDMVQRQPGSGPLIQYHNCTIYVPLEDGVMAIADNGTEMWKKRFDRKDYPFLPEDTGSYTEQYSKYFDAPEGGDFLFDEYMLFDRDGNLYMKYAADVKRSGSYYTIVLAPDGTVASSRKVSAGSNATGIPARDEVLYKLETASANATAAGQATLTGSTKTYTLAAYDGQTEVLLWKYTVPPCDPEEGELNEVKIRQYFDVDTADRLINFTRTRNMSFLVGQVFVYYGTDNSSWYSYYRNWNLSSPVLSMSSTDVRPGKDRVYLDVRTFNYENPAIYTSPRYTYSGGVYALDTNGTLLWSIPVALNDRLLTTGNSTIFYETGDGKLYVKYSGAAAGITLLSALFLFFKYFLAGTVSRARSRLDKNENRTAILQYVRDHPGSTMYEIARGANQNLGTVRYHLLILGINHKVLEHRPDGKFVRYFTNSDNYSQQEQTVISLMKRDSTRKVLCLLHRKPGASNGEISRELDIPESIASRCTKELADRGLIVKEPVGRGFVVKEEYGKLLAGIVDRD